MRPSHLQDDQLALRLAVEPVSVGVARRAAAQYAEQVGCDAATLPRVRLAISEAVSNVVLHAHADGEAVGHHVLLVGQADPRSCTISVSDEGSGLRPRADSPGMGLGLALMASSCDELVLDAGPEGGTIVRMTFLR